MAYFSKKPPLLLPFFNFAYYYFHFLMSPISAPS